MKKLFLYFLVIFAVQACVIDPAPIDVDIEEPAPQLVLNTIGLPPSIFSVILTNTFSALIPTQDTLIEDIDVDLINQFIVANADISISYEDKYFELEQLLPGIYGTIEAELKPNVEYTLDLVIPDDDRKISATTTILPPVDIKDFRLEKVSEEDDSLYNVTIALEDPLDSENYFLIAHKATTNTDLPDLTSILNGAANFQIFSDQEFLNEDEIEYKLSRPYDLGDTLSVSLSHITRDYYDYLTAYKRVGNIFNSIISEPIRTLPDNVDGGLGYFNLAVPRVENIIIE